MYHSLLGSSVHGISQARILEWEKIIANYLTNKKLILKIYKHLTQLNIKLTNYLINNEPKTGIDIFPKYTHMANKHMKRCLISLIIREIQIMIAMRYHLIPVRMAVIQKTTNNTCWWGWRKGELLVETKSGVVTVENSMEVSQKSENRITIWSSSSTPGSVSKEKKTNMLI